MSINIPRPRNIHERIKGVLLDEVNDFKYLGAYVGSTTHDIKIRKGPAWKAFLIRYRLVIHYREP